MMSLGLPHITVLSKCDLVEDKSHLDRYLNLEYKERLVDLEDDSHIKLLQQNKGDIDSTFKQPANPQFFSEKYLKLSERLREIVDNYSLVCLLPLDINDDETITDIIYHADNNIQFGENREADEGDYIKAEQGMMGVDHEAKMDEMFL